MEKEDLNTANQQTSDMDDVDSIKNADKPTAPKKKGKAGLLLILLAVICLIGGISAYYFIQRRQPENCVSQYLTNVQNMDFSAMEALLQSNDMSALDNADIRNESYADFFRGINSKMTYEIKSNKFDIANGTASVTAQIRYIDGSEIYKETTTEFLKQIVSSAFSGKEMSEQDTQQLLASILNEKSQTTQDQFQETDIVYPVIKTASGWKIVSLDDETVKIMSANFKSVEDEIQSSLSTTADGSGENSSANAPTAGEGDIISLSNDKFTIQYTQFRVVNDISDSPCLMFYYDYTNNSSSPSSPMADVVLKAYQNGASLDPAIPQTDDAAVDRYLSDAIQPGETANVCQVFSLTDMSDVTIEAGEAFSFSDSQIATQNIKVQ